MDARRFDHLTRQLGSARDRRRLLSATAAAMLGALGLRATAAAQDECAVRCPSGERCVNGACIAGCENDRHCRNKHDDPCVANMCIDGLCVSAIVDCLPGYECCEGECCAKGCVDDAECALLEPCRWGRCGDDGQCAFTTLNPCVICTFDEECLNSGQNTVCCDGACRRPCPEGTVMGKGCECGAIGLTSMDDVLVVDDASG